MGGADGLIELRESPTHPLGICRIAVGGWSPIFVPQHDKLPDNMRGVANDALRYNAQKHWRGRKGRLTSARTMGSGDMVGDQAPGVEIINGRHYG